MAATERIDQIINVPKIQEQINTTNAALDSIVDRMVIIAKHSEQIKMDFGGLKGTQAMTKALKELAKANEDAEKANKLANAALAKQATLQQQLNAALKGNTGNRSLDEQIRLNKKINDLKSNESKETFRLKKEVAELTAARKAEQQTMKGAKDSLEAIAKEAKELTLQYSRLSRAEKEAASGRQLQSKIKALNTEIRESKVALAAMGANVGNYSASIVNAYTKIGTFIAGISGTIYAAKKVIDYNAQLSDSMADVRKTTGMTQEQVNTLNEALRKVDTRTAQNSLLDLGVVAGKLGVPLEEILGFIKSADQIGVALGRDLGDAEQAVNALGKMVAIFRVNEQFGFEKALLKVGSALRELGNDSTATEENIVEFTKMFGGVAPLAGLTIDQVMGLGATLDQLGQSAEVSSTALSAVFLKLFKESKDFARIAGLNAKEFSRVLKTDVNEAFIMFLEGLGRNKGGLEELGKKMDGLGVDGRRVTGVLGVLTTHIDTLRRSQELSRDEMDKGTALTEQFTIKNNNLAASIDKITKAWKNLLANSGTVSFLSKGLDAIAGQFKDLADVFSDDPLDKLELKLRMAKDKYADKGIPKSDLEQTRLKIEMLEQQIKIINDQRAADIAAIEAQKEKNKLLRENVNIEKQRYGDGSQEWMPGTGTGIMTRGVPPVPKPELLLESQDEILTKKEQRAAASAKRLHDREIAAQERLDNTVEKLLEKSYQVRVELGLVSLEEQESHEKAMLKTRIEELNAASKKQGRNEVINWEETNKMMETITLKYIDKQNDAEKASFEKNLQYLNKIKEKLTDNARVAEISDLTKISKDKFAEKDDLRAKLASRNITIEEYKRQEKEINEKYDQMILESSIAIIEKQMTTFQAYGLDTLDLENKLALAKIALQEKTTAATIENVEKRKEAEEKAQKDMLDKSMQLFNSLSNLFNTLYDGQLQKIDEKIDANKTAWEKELEQAKGNEKLERQINKRRSDAENALALEKKKIAREQANINKITASANAAINTAVGVTGALASAASLTPAGAIAMAIIIGLAGAAEIAAILATPIPSYEKGREDGPAEIAKVHPGELIKYPSGEMAFTPDRETLTYLPAHAEVIPHHELLKMAGRFSAPSTTYGRKDGVFVNIENPYGKEMLTELRKEKTQTIITDMGDYILRTTGNYSLKIRK